MQLKTDEMIADVRGGIGWMTFNNPERLRRARRRLGRSRLLSAPEEKARPAPRITATCTPASAAVRSSSASSSSSSAGLIAFSHSGRSSVSVATPSARS